jgi:cardiolipin synthase (CMP-forming)
MWKKRLADGLSMTRFLLALCLVWLGFSQGAAGLNLAVTVLLAAWLTDVVDGPLARSSGVKTQTWIGAHDIYIDVAMGTAATIYLQRAGFLDGRIAVAYLLIWAIIFWRLSSLLKTFGAIFQAPVYGWFIWTAMRHVPKVGLWLLLYVAVYVILAWNHLMRRGLPEFLQGLRDGLTRVFARAGGRGHQEGRHGTGSSPGCD